ATELTHFAMAWHVPEIAHPDVPALDLLSVILGEGHSSRLYRKVREESGLAFSISAFSYTPGDPGILGVDAILDPKNRSAAQSLILQIIEDIRRDGVSAEELAKGKKTRSDEQIADQLEAVGGEITVQAGNNSFAVNLDITQPDLALGTDILADVLLNATMPATAVAREKEIQLAKIKDEEEKPTS